MATCKLSVRLTDAQVGESKIGGFDLDVEATYTQEELLAVLAALPAYMQSMLDLFEGEGNENQNPIPSFT